MIKPLFISHILKEIVCFIVDGVHSIVESMPGWMSTKHRAKARDPLETYIEL